LTDYLYRRPFDRPIDTPPGAVIVTEADGLGDGPWTERTALRGLLATVSPGDAVYVWSISYFDTHPGRLAELVRFFLNRGATIRDLKDRAVIEPDDRNALKIVQAIGRSLEERGWATTRITEMRQNTRPYIGGPVPFGKKKIRLKNPRKKILVNDPAQQMVLDEAFWLAEGGMSYREIAELFKKVHTFHGEKWTRERVEDLVWARRNAIKKGTKGVPLPPLSREGAELSASQLVANCRRALSSSEQTAEPPPE
jgi:hypothetical protein